MNIKKCTCGADAFVFREAQGTRLRGRWYYVACSECQNRGHTMESANTAINHWNEG